MEQVRLSFKNSRINYCRFGSGPKTAFCFHGFGEEGAQFEFLSKYAGNQYTFFAIDLPFHGKTEWKEEDPFTVEDLQQIITQILNSVGSQQSAVGPPGSASSRQSASYQNPESSIQNPESSIQHPASSNQQLSLIGFSLGGRVALHLYQTMPERTERLVLLAPDGLKINFWYWFSTQTWFGNKLFAVTMKHPFWFFGFLKLLNKLGMVNASVFKFVNYYIGKKEIRLILYKRWTTLRKLRPNLPLIKSFIRKNNTPVRLIYGEHDRIILSSVGEKFRKGIEQQTKLTIIHSGHQVLHETHVREILPALLD